MDAMGAWEIEDRAREVLAGAGVQDIHAKLGTLSGREICQIYSLVLGLWLV